MRVLYSIAVGILYGALCAANLSQAALTGQWEFDEGTGSIAGNSVVGGADGVITNDLTGGLGTGGSVWVNDPVFGSVISFNGAVDGAFVRAGSLPVMTLDQDFTWAFWANNMEATEPNNIIVGNRYNDATPPGEFVPRQFIKFTPTQFELHSNANGNDNLDYDDLPLDQWIHSAIVKDGAQITYYRDGVEASTKTVTQAQVDSMPLFFGGNNSGDGGENWHGLLDDVRTYDNALSAEEVAELVQIAAPGDVNMDAFVNTDDLDIIRGNYFENVTGSREERFGEGDLNSDSIVDFLDYRIWKDNYVPASSASASTSVPEPACLVLALLGGVALYGVRRRN